MRKQAVAVIAGIVMVVLLSAPAHAAALAAAQADPFSQLQQWLQQASGIIYQIQATANQLRAQVFQIITSSLQQSGGWAMIQQVQGVLGQLGQLTGPFGWAYDNALADLQRLLGGGAGAGQVGSPGWFATNNPGTKQTVARATESAVATAAAVERSQQAAQQAAETAQRVTASQDVAAAARQTYGIANQLKSGATNVPSTRAGVQMLIAGQAAALQAQADNMQAVAARLNAATQQDANLAQQLDALAQATKQVADNQQAAAQKEEQDKQEVLAAAGEGATGIVRTMIKFLVNGVTGQPQNSGQLFRFRRK